MNFLAHSYLSFSEEQLVGNMIADFVKNRDVARLPESIQKGIKLHRAICTSADTRGESAFPTAGEIVFWGVCGCGV